MYLIIRTKEGQKIQTREEYGSDMINRFLEDYRNITDSGLLKVRGYDGDIYIPKNSIDYFEAMP